MKRLLLNCISLGMKKLVFATLVLCGSTVFATSSQIDGDYDCDGKGMRIVGDTVDFYLFSMKSCRRKGVVYFFRESCEGESVYVFAFDSVTFKLTQFVGSHEEKYHCKKLR